MEGVLNPNKEVWSGDGGSGSRIIYNTRKSASNRETMMIAAQGSSRGSGLFRRIATPRASVFSMRRMPLQPQSRQRYAFLSKHFMTRSFIQK